MEGEIDGRQNRAGGWRNYFGEKVFLPGVRRCALYPISEGIEVDSAGSKTGNILGNVIRYYPIQIAPTFSNVSRNFVFRQYGYGAFGFGEQAWGEAFTFRDFWEFHVSKLWPFFFAWDIDTFPDHVFWLQIDEAGKFETPVSVSQYVDQLKVPMKGVRE